MCKLEPPTVEVRLYGALRRFAENSDVASECIMNVAFRSGDSVADVLHHLGIQDGEVSNVFRNGRLATLDTPVQPGDRVGVFPPTMAFLYC